MIGYLIIGESLGELEVWICDNKDEGIGKMYTHFRRKSTATSYIRIEIKAYKIFNAEEYPFISIEAI